MKISSRGLSVTFKSAPDPPAVIIHKARTFELSLTEFLEAVDALRNETLRRLGRPPMER